MVNEVKVCTWCMDAGCSACDDGYQADSISWSELSELTHVTQVERFGFCLCEDSEPQYEDCPTREGV